MPSPVGDDSSEHGDEDDPDGVLEEVVDRHGRPTPGSASDGPWS